MDDIFYKNLVQEKHNLEWKLAQAKEKIKNLEEHLNKLTEAAEIVRGNDNVAGLGGSGLESGADGDQSAEVRKYPPGHPGPRPIRPNKYPGETQESWQKRLDQHYHRKQKWDDDWREWRRTYTPPE